MAVDWKATGARGIPTNPYIPLGLTPPSPFMQPGAIHPGLVGPGFGNPAMFGVSGTPYGLNGLDQIGGGYGFTPPGLTPYAAPFASPFAFGGSIPGAYTPYAMGSPAAEQLSDQDLEKLVEDVLGVDPLTCNADIQVQSQDHTVTLTGTVASRMVKIAAGNDIWLVPGVRDVNNTIQIKSRTQHGKKTQTQRETVSVGRS